MSTLAVIATSALTGVIGAAAMYVPARLARHDAATYRDLAEQKLDECEARDAAYEQARTLQPFWSFDAPELPAAAEHEGEVLHVEHATAELRQLIAQLDATDDDAIDVIPERAVQGLTDLAEEVALVQALSDRPADDEDEIGDEQPGEAASGLLARLHAFLRWLDDVTDRLHDWLPNLLQQWRERNDVGTGEQAVALDRFERFRIDDNPRGRSDTTEAEERDVKMEAWQAANPPPNPQPYRGRHWVSDVQHTGQFPIVIPAPREAGDDRG